MTVEFMPPGADIFESGCEALVNPVDAATGAQSKGLAKAFKQRYPDECEAYRRAARACLMFPGGVWVSNRAAPRILFAATKRHWREKSRIDFITTAATNICHEMIALHSRARSIALPALGCGEGGLNWDDVRPHLLNLGHWLAEAGVLVRIYEPWEETKWKRR